MSTDIIGYRVTQKLIPLAGPNAAIQPPTYSAKDKNDSTPKFAVSTEVRDGREVKNVIINSVPAEAHALSEVMKDILDDVLVDGAPGVYIGAADSEDVEKVIATTLKTYTTRKKDPLPADYADEVADTVRERFSRPLTSTWEASHRHVDGLVRYAKDPSTGGQVWAANSELGQTLRRMGRGEGLVRSFPNAALLGYFLANRSPETSSLARSIRSEVIGHDVSEVYTGATKVDDILGALADSTLIDKDGTVSRSDEKAAKAPSAYVLGSIPSTPTVTGFVCRDIERVTTFSTRSLRKRVTASDDALDAVEALGILAMIGNASSSDFRSNASLVPSGAPVVEAIDSKGNFVAVNAEELEAQARETLEKLAETVFDKPVHVAASDVHISLAADRTASNMAAKTKEND